jgi:hypothetical protein
VSDSAFGLIGFTRKPIEADLGTVSCSTSNCLGNRLLAKKLTPPRRGCAAEQRDELAPFHCPMPPVLPTERIAHLSRLLRCGILGVMNRSKTTSALSPFDSQLRTLVGAARRSHSCQ